MGRPPLILETWGKIRRTTVRGQPAAVAYYRDSDGVTRKMQRAGRTPAEAERILVQAMKDRLTPSTEYLTGDSNVEKAVTMWLDEASNSGKSEGTMRRYRSVAQNHVVKGLGSVRLREASVPRLDRFVKAVAANTGAATAQLCVVILSGSLDLATRHGAMSANPMRSVAPVTREKAPVTALSVEDVQAINAIFSKWDKGVDKRGMDRTTDLGDVALMFAATGARTGEILALRWPDLDLGSEPARVDITTTVALDSQGKLCIQPRPKSTSSMRGLMLPPFATEMLLRRRAAAISEYVCPSSALTLRNPSNMRLQWTRALEGTKYTGIVPRTYRKAVATLIKQMAGSEAAKDQLGHSSLTTTERHYIEQAQVRPDATAILELFRPLNQSSE